MPSQGDAFKEKLNITLRTKGGYAHFTSNFVLQLQSLPKNLKFEK
jgi:hypothetical protein